VELLQVSIKGTAVTTWSGLNGGNSACGFRSQNSLKHKRKEKRKYKRMSLI